MSGVETEVATEEDANLEHCAKETDLKEQPILHSVDENHENLEPTPQPMEDDTKNHEPARQHLEDNTENHEPTRQSLEDNNENHELTSQPTENDTDPTIDGTQRMDPEGEDLQTQQSDTNKKKKRGPTRMRKVSKDTETKVNVEFTEVGEHAGPGSVTLSSFLGCVGREHVPVILPDWRQLDDQKKDTMWEEIKVYI